MALWGQADASSNAVLSAAGGLNKAPNTANRDALYGNSTADAFVTGQTIGLYNINDSEMLVTTLGLATVAANNPGSGGHAIPGDTLTIANSGGTVSQPATVNVYSVELRALSIAAPIGTGFANGDLLTIETGSPTTAPVLTVTTGTSNTSIASLAITGRGKWTTAIGPNNVALVVSDSESGDIDGGTCNVLMRVADLQVKTSGLYTAQPNSVGLAANPATGGGATGVTLVVTFGNKENEAKRAGMTGWALRREGSGGRAGRVTYELLVAGVQSTNGTSDDTNLPQ